ncbi:threonine dehydratase [Pseudoduganella violacea]|uniref:Threonine dehydratase n=1 Tax=Pseudoduganella violacea TaxID=1715466 RepID=A0A7W5BFI1_9BURK|nr:threonine dehydratase [Pseudoduganella violacea]MBB3121350.1 threonine dehydratase [Pseudoduganella violacea]
MSLPSPTELEAAAAIVYGAMPPTPQFSWPLLNEALGTEAWIKHENHTPTGAFKVRGGLVYLHALSRREPQVRGVIAATRGNHGQSLAFAARRHGLGAHIVVPHGNSVEKNAAMRALGAQLIEYGDDFQAAREHAQMLARRDGLHMVPSWHPDLVAGVATGYLELFHAQPDLDTLFVPIGQGSGICAALAARQALGLKTRVIGVVSEHALAYQLSFHARRPMEAPVGTELADGLACRMADASSLPPIIELADDIVAVSDEQVARAMRLYYRCTHNLSEGAGAAALAAALLLKNDPRVKGRKLGLPLTGANVDAPLLQRVLDEQPFRSVP